MLKSEWQEYKRTVQQLKREVSSLAFGTKQHDKQQSAQMQEFETGSLVEICGVPDSSKQSLTERIRHFVKPSYVDLTSERAIVRFGCKVDAEMFMQRHNMTGCKLTVLNEKQTKEYF